MQSSSKKSLNTIILAPLTPYKPKKCRAKFLEQKKFKRFSYVLYLSHRRQQVYVYLILEYFFLIGENGNTIPVIREDAIL